MAAGLALAIGLPAPAAKRPKPAPCPGAFFVVDSGAPLVVGSAATVADAVTVVEGSASGPPRVALASGCPLTAARLKATRKGTRVKAAWPPGACLGTRGRVRLAARTDTDCNRLAGRIRAGRKQRGFEAHRFDGTVRPSLDAARSASALIDESGGRLDATGADGTVYRLTVPAHALVVPQTITMTPLGGLADLPFAGGLTAGVDLGPSGLQLAVPAVLSIAPAVTPDATMALVGFGYDGQGEGFHLELLERNADAISLHVTHFSGFGAGTTAPPSSAALSSLPWSSTEQQYKNQLGSNLGAGSATLLSILIAWFEAGVQPSLQAGFASDAALARATREYLEWVDAAITLSLLGEPAFAARDATAKGLAAPALEAAILRANQRCRAQQSFAGAEDALRWQHIAEYPFGVATGTLALDAVLADLCLEVAYVDTSFPLTPQVGAQEPLDVTVGVAFDGDTPVFQQPLAVTVTASGAQPGSASGTTNGQGVFHASFQPAGGTDVSLTIESCIAAPPYPKLRLVCQTALVVRGLDVVPAAVTLATGGTQQFAARLVGQPTTDVTWAATGGSIDATGKYTAGNVPGTYQVKATSLTNASLSATADVTIGSSPPMGTVVWKSAQCRVNCSASGGVESGPSYNDGGGLGGSTMPVPYVDSCEGSGSAADPNGSASSMASASNSTDYLRHPTTNDPVGIQASASVSAQAMASGMANAGGDAIADCGGTFDVVGGPVAYTATASLSENAPADGESVALVNLGKRFGAVVFFARDEPLSSSGSLSPGTYDFGFTAKVVAGAPPGGGGDASVTFRLEMESAP